MPTPIVRLIASRQEHVLGNDPTVVRAGPIVLAVDGVPSKTILLDGAPVRVVAGVVAMDLTRSTGYHCVRAGERDFWFATADEKLGLDGIERMLSELRSSGTGWTGQMLFSDTAMFRDPHVVYGWLELWADSALKACAAIIASPVTTQVQAQKISRRGGSRVIRPATMRLLRASPRRLLVPALSGPFELSGQRYSPLRVVAQTRRNTVDSPSNRRTKAILRTLLTFAEEVSASSPDKAVKARCRGWAGIAQRLLARPASTGIGDDRSTLALPRQSIELSDPRYREVWRTAADLRYSFGWAPTTVVSRRLSYVQSADSIYQAYVASMMAAALGMRQIGAVLGEVQPAFRSEDFDLYFDTRPPDDVLRSWRSFSALPDDSRPDFILHERSSGRIAVMDAKYRLSGSGNATEDSRKEVTSYMGLYGLDSVAILYPGAAGSGRDVSGAGRTIVEVPLKPGVDLMPAVSRLLGMLRAPTI